MKFFTTVFTAISVFFGSFIALFSGTSTYNYRIDATSTGGVIPNIVDNINVWDMGTQFYNATRNEKYDVYKFVKYVQLMQCTGGTYERDLFKDPRDTSTLTDYDFTRLINNCRGILGLGAKPHLKLGGVPIKYTTDAVLGGFNMNVYPPDDYNVYYNYIKAMALALVDEFGLDEVRTWRFGCMTEYENAAWFYAKDETPKSSLTAYCKLYDYTVQALIDVIGEDVFVGAHCMGVTEGLWDERDFLKHCGTGKNYATGEKGARICFVSASFYDSRPGKYTKGFTLPQLMRHLKKAADKYGLDNIIFGIDEGRILSGVNSGKDDDALDARKTGYTWQAAYDARLFKQAIDSGMDYFSSWSFLTGGNLSGYPTISYHVANNIYKFAGGRQAKVTKTHMNAGFKIESDCLASWDEDSQTLRLMAYNFKNSLEYDKDMKVNFDIKSPLPDGKTVTVIKYLVNDDCNFFDEWLEDRKTYGIGNDCFSWSPDDACIDGTVTLSDSRAREIYFSKLRDGYEECARLTPVTETAVVENGRLKLSETLGAGNVVFYEIH
ncbi:MAG: hypothetical protein IJT03_08495 [Clostridia bacterium]|nr:hypothetical protein [Clostridia bacterium]